MNTNTTNKNSSNDKEYIESLSLTQLSDDFGMSAKCIFKLRETISGAVKTKHKI